MLSMQHCAPLVLCLEITSSQNQKSLLRTFLAGSTVDSGVAARRVPSTAPSAPSASTAATCRPRANPRLHFRVPARPALPAAGAATDWHWLPG